MKNLALSFYSFEAGIAARGLIHENEYIKPILVNAEPPSATMAQH